MIGPQSCKSSLKDLPGISSGSSEFTSECLEALRGANLAALSSLSCSLGANSSGIVYVWDLRLYWEQGGA